ncbi:hypothetical protein CW304_20555 [Bacillus sp. UFRGS-B20]|nr:hypothetical protein CW304_20555 [Bacillus sp. UFRGS-B20]
MLRRRVSRYPHSFLILLTKYKLCRSNQTPSFTRRPMPRPHSVPLSAKRCSDDASNDSIVNLPSQPWS